MKKPTIKLPGMEDLASATRSMRDITSFIDNPPPATQKGRPEKIGMRFDKGKLRMDLVPPELIEGIAKLMGDGLRVDLVPIESIKALAAVLTFGAKKYKPRNWERGLKYRSTYASLQRHLMAWRKGDRVDSDSKLPTLYGALFGITALITFEERGMGKELNDFLEEE